MSVSKTDHSEQKSKPQWSQTLWLAGKITIAESIDAE